MKGVIRGHGAKKTWWIDNKEVTKEEFLEFFPDKPLDVGDGQGLIGWNKLRSDALAVHPRQIKEAMDDAKKKGVPVDFLSDGRPEFTSREQRANYMRAYGFFDKSGGYGDAMQGSFKDKPDEPDPVKELCGELGARVTKEGTDSIVREIINGRE